ICFNHESPRRGFEFVTRKISRVVAMIKFGLLDKIKLGNLDAKRDWGYAPEYVEAMYLMLQQDKPDDYIIATGETHSVKKFVQLAFETIGLDWEEYIEIDRNLFRPAEVYELRGDITKIKKNIGWKPKVKFKELVELMVKNDIKEIYEIQKK
ncbi:MAG: GDP-mannose 4,6-dehydratase, partial [Endomicrobiia bacterium]